MCALALLPVWSALLCSSWPGCLWLTDFVICGLLVRISGLAYYGLIAWLFVAYCRLISLAYCGLLTWLFAAYWSGLLAWLIMAYLLSSLLLPDQAYCRLIAAY